MAPWLDIALAEQPDRRSRRRPRPQRFLRAVLRNRKATVGALILFVMAFVAAFPGLIAPDSPQASLYAAEAGPSSRTCSAPRSSARTCSPSSCGARA